MVDVRRAVAADTDELVRLRTIMLTWVDATPPVPGPWQDNAAETLRDRLDAPDDTFAAFVVEAPDQPGTLAACVVGTIEHRLGSPRNPAGAVGYVFSVATDPAYRLRGYARACMEALLAWYDDHGVNVVDLKTSPDGERLYLSLGFIRTTDPAMRRRRPI